jgi:Protein of unknown function (DUF1706)
MGDKQHLLHDANEAYAELREAIRNLDDADASRPWLGTWGVREILIHIAAWDREMAPALERIGRGEAPYPDGAYDDFDAWNARFVEARTGAKGAEIVDDLDASHQSLIAVASKLDEALFAGDGPAKAILDGTGPQHYREHAAQIREWRKEAR